MSSENSWAALERIHFTLDPELDIVSPVLGLGLQCWNDARNGAPLPARQNIDPIKLPIELLPHVLLIDVVHRPALRFRWRLIGTHITEKIGRDSTGKWWDEIYAPDVMAEIANGPLWTIEHRRPIRTLGRAPLPDRAFLRSENIDMPLSGDGTEIDMIMVVSVYD